MRSRHASLLAALTVAAVALLLLPASAAAKAVPYFGEGVNVKSGQTRGQHPVFVTFNLIGDGCPTGPKCFDHAKVGTFTSIAWAYPNCPEILDGSFEIAKPDPRPVTPSRHTFSIAGISELYPATHVEIHGRILPSGTARGWFEVSEGPCSTGHIAWTAKPE